MMTSFPNFSAASFSRLFALPRPKLRHLSVEFGDGSDMSIVFNVLVEKVDSLASFSCMGASLSVESLKVFLTSQKNLAKIRFRTEDECVCQDHGDHAEDEEGRNEMGLNWKTIVNPCINHRGLTEIECTCDSAGYESEDTGPGPDYTSAFSVDRGKDLIHYDLQYESSLMVIAMRVK